MTNQRLAYWQDQIRSIMPSQYQNVNFIIDYPTLNLLDNYGLDALNLEIRNRTIKTGYTLNYTEDREYETPTGTELEVNVAAKGGINNIDGVYSDLSITAEVETQYDGVSFIYDLTNFDEYGNPSIQFETIIRAQNPSYSSYGKVYVAPELIDAALSLVP